jgi:hypothetical protein
MHWPRSWKKKAGLEAGGRLHSAMELFLAALGHSGIGQGKFANASSLDWAVTWTVANGAASCAQPRLRPDRHPCPRPSVAALATDRRGTGWHASADAC